MDMMGVLFGGYLFFALLYYIFRPSTASATKEARKVLKNKEKIQIQSTGQKLVGSSLGYILINQMQIIALIKATLHGVPICQRGWLIF